MSKGNMTPKQKGYVGLGAMVVLSAATIWGSEPLYKAIDNFGKEPIYTAGTYTGTAKGFGGDVIANVTVSTTSIEKIELKGDSETPGIGSNALEQLPGQIMGKGTTEVDAVSGATITSDAVRDAVDQALALARGEEIEATTEAAPETEATTEAATTAEKPEYQFTAGTYTGEADGYGGKVTAEVTVSDTAIIEIKVKGSDETEEIGGNALKKMPGKIVDAQTTAIDGVSSATVTSDAIKLAVDHALEQASGGAPADSGTGVSFAPGTYTGEADGYGGKVTAEVTVSAAGIEDIKVKGPDETEEIGGNALKKLPKKMLEAKSADVDAISGATVTSDAIKAAVKAAMQQAAESVNAGNAGEPDGAGEVTPEGAALMPGTYTGEAQGYGGKVTAEVLISEAGIDDIKIKASDETEEIGGSAVKKLTKKMLEAQSADVDAVTGATITSDAVKDAVNQALESARG